MKTLTIPKSLVDQGELVVIPRYDYEQLLARPVRIRSVKVARSVEREPSGLDRRLTKSLAEVKQGKVHGPFDNVDDLMHSLRKFKKSQ